MKLSFYSSLCTLVALATSTAGRTVLRVADNVNISPVFVPDCVQDTHSHSQAVDFHEVTLPGWVPGPSLIPGRLLLAFRAADKSYNADSFGQFILEACQRNSECTAAMSYNAFGHGTPKGRLWFGYTFGGGPVTPEDFELAPSEQGVRDVRVYTV